MGTNFYRKKLPTIEEKETLHKLIDKGDLDSLSYKLNEYTEAIHLCKRSAGWLIAFDHNNGKYYQPNRKSLEEFLNEPNTTIVDEYGETYTPKDFWEMVDEWNSSRPDLWNGDTYREWEIKEHNKALPDYCSVDREKVKRLFNIDVPNKGTDFSVDGLRFNVFTDFS